MKSTFQAAEAIIVIIADARSKCGCTESFLIKNEVARGTSSSRDINRGRLVFPVSKVENGSEDTLSAKFIRSPAAFPVIVVAITWINGRGKVKIDVNPPASIIKADGMAIILVKNDITGSE